MSVSIKSPLDVYPVGQCGVSLASSQATSRLAINKYFKTKSFIFRNTMMVERIHYEKDFLLDNSHSRVTNLEIQTLRKRAQCDGHLKILEAIGLLMLLAAGVLIGLRLQGMALGMTTFTLSIAMFLTAASLRDEEITPMDIYRSKGFTITPCNQCLRSCLWTGISLGYIFATASIFLCIAELKNTSNFDANPENLLANASSPRNTTCYLPSLPQYHVISTLCPLWSFILRQ